MKTGRTTSGNQRYKCQRRYTPEPKQAAYSDELRQQAVQMHDEFIKKTRQAVTEGASALFLLTSNAMVDKVVEARSSSMRLNWCPRTSVQKKKTRCVQRL